MGGAPSLQEATVGSWKWKELKKYLRNFVLLSLSAQIILRYFLRNLKSDKI